MKIKYNIPKLNQIKEFFNKIKGNIKTKKDSLNKPKVPIRYYGLLILMVILGIVTLSHNVKEYSKSIKEEYIEYNLEDKIKGNSTLITSNEKVFLTAESSISVDEKDNEKLIDVMSKSNVKELLPMPLNGKIIKEFAMEKLVYSNTLGMWKTHPGIDIKATIGDKVISVSDGKVTQVLNDDFYGYTVKIEDSEGYIFVYSNLDGDITLNIGDIVKQKEIIGKVGVSSMGELEDECHLHFEVIKDNKNINPLDLLQYEE